MVEDQGIGMSPSQLLTIFEAFTQADGTTTGLGSVPAAAKNLSAAILKSFNGSGATPWKSVTSFVDGTQFLTVYYVANAYAWANATIHFDANTLGAGRQ